MGLILSAPAPSGQAWSTIPINGGGFVTGMDIAPDGTTIVRSDTYPAVFLLNGAKTKWSPLVTANSMPAGYISPRSNFESGCWEARIAPNLPTTIYMVYGSAGSQGVFKTTNSGGTWTQLTGFTANISDAEPNDGTYRATNHKMAVDPANDAIVYLGTPSAGLQKTTNGGTSWLPVTIGSGSASANGYAIAFDPTSSAVSNVTQGIFVLRHGDGVYHSIDGGGNWTQLNTTGMPTTFAYMMVDAGGKLWVAHLSGGNQNVWSWTSGGGWVQCGATDSGGFQCIAVNPFDTTKIALNSFGGYTYTSSNGTTFTASSASTTVTGTGDQPWVSTTWSGGSYNGLVGKMIFDPVTNGKLWQTHGFGVWYANPTMGASSITWLSKSNGIESLDCTSVIHPPGGHPIMTAWDLPIWNLPSFTANASVYGPDSDFGGVFPLKGVFGVRGWCQDYSKSDPTFIVSVNSADPGYSTDSGAHWTVFGSVTPFANVSNGGCIAASTNTNFVAMSSTGVFYTTNGGTIWPPSTYAGNLAGSNQAGSNFVAADHVNANTFYIYSPNDGLYKSTNSGVTFAKVSGTNLNLATNNEEGFALRVKAVPGNAGHLFITGGFLDTGTPPAVGSKFRWSIDSGATWSQVSNIVEVMSFSFGTIVAGQSYPTIYIAGWVSSAFGVFKCVNFNPSTGAGTWTRLGEQYPEGWFAVITDIAGDPSVDGACTITFNNGGVKTFR